MNISNWIRYNLELCKRGKHSFTKACRYIACHKDVKLNACNDMIASFEINFGTYKSSITIKNTEEYSENYVELDVILAKVSEASKIPVEAIQSKLRLRKIVEARHAYMIIAKKINNSSLGDIGNLVNRDHCTVLHATKMTHIPNIQKIIAATNLL